MSVWEGQKNTVISSTACAPAPALPLGSFPERVNQYRSGLLLLKAREIPAIYLKTHSAGVASMGVAILARNNAAFILEKLGR